MKKADRLKRDSIMYWNKKSFINRLDQESRLIDSQMNCQDPKFPKMIDFSKELEATRYTREERAQLDLMMEVFA